MLENMGMNFEGQQHSGIDDSRNIARIIIRMLDDGADLRINERLHQHKLNGLEELEPEILVVSQEEGSDSDDSDNDCSKEPYSTNHLKPYTNDCDVSAIAAAMGNMDLATVPRTSSQPSRGIREDDEYDDLLAYYALQST